MLSWEQWHSIDREAFPKLCTLEIKGCPVLASSIPKCPNIQELLIIQSQNVVLQEQKLPPSLRLVAISGARMSEPLSQNIHIEHLTVHDCSDEFPVIHMTPSVKKLHIAYCENLGFVLASKAPLVHLQRISIYDCKFLRCLFDDMEHLLPNLQELCIERCPEMEPFSAALLPSSLIRLEIRECDKLLSSHTQWHHLPTISTLCISTQSDTLHCRGLQHLISLQQLEIRDSPKLEKIEGGMMPPYLQRLHIWDCRLLEERCINKDEEIWPKILHVPYISLDCRHSRDDANTHDMHQYSCSVKSTEDQERDIMNELQHYRYLRILLGSRSYHNLIDLRLNDCDNWWRIPTLGQLPALRSLTIERSYRVVTVGSEFFKAHDSASLVPFPSLESLHFEHMISWKQWHSIDMQAFPKLRSLRLHDCPKLIGNLPLQLLSLELLDIRECPLLASSIPKCPKLHHLHINKSQNVVLQEQDLPPSLRRLRVSGVRMLETLSGKLHIESLYVGDCSDVVPLPTIHMSPSLKELFIEDCENAKFFLVSEAPLAHLQRISAYDCTFLRCLFDEFERLPNLEELCIIRCPEMESFTEGLLPSNLKRLEIRDCDELLILSRHTNQWNHLSSITELHISTLSDTLYCNGLQNLTSLQQLEIRDSPHLENIEGGMMPPSLQRLLIWDCRLFEQRCRINDQKIWPKISHVPCITLNGTDLRCADSPY